MLGPPRPPHPPHPHSPPRPPHSPRQHLLAPACGPAGCPSGMSTCRHTIPQPPASGCGCHTAPHSHGPAPEGGGRVGREGGSRVGQHVSLPPKHGTTLFRSRQKGRAPPPSCPQSLSHQYQEALQPPLRPSSGSATAPPWDQHQVALQPPLGPVSGSATLGLTLFRSCTLFCIHDPGRERPPPPPTPYPRTNALAPVWHLHP